VPGLRRQPGGRKWRPSLALVLGGTIAAVLCLPIAGIVGVRWLWPVIGYEQSVFIVAALILGITGAFGLVLWRLLYGPVTRLAARARAGKAGQPGAFDPVPHYGTSEMAELGRAMLDMGRVLRGREAVVRSYADHATHELKTPLTALRAAAELLQDPGLGPAERDRLGTRITEAVERMTHLLEVQQRYARAQEPMGQGPSNLSKVLGGLSLPTDLTGSDVTPLPPEVLQTTLDHLSDNAARAGATRLTLEATPGGLTVIDDGPGIAEGDRARVFDPFFTTRRAEGGTGMGLPIVRRLLEAHGATIALSPDQPETGARFDLGWG